MSRSWRGGVRSGDGRSWIGLLGRLAVAALLAGATAGLGAGAVAAADPFTFGTPTASSSFDKSLEFVQPVGLSVVPTRVELLLEEPGSDGPNVVDVDPPTATGEQTLRYEVDLTTGHVVPNTRFIVRWRLTDAAGKVFIGPKVTHTYDDDRFSWQSLDGDIVRVHWHEGDAAFGRRALKIGDDAVAATSKLLGVTETDPIDFYIYADQQQFYDALGPGTRENVGGEAHPDIRTLFALITPSEINDSWVRVVVPHELTHLVFATAIDNPYREPPNWLNEGLAVYLSEGYTPTDRSQVEQVSRDGTVIPLEGLAGAFPTTRDRFFLAYAESVAAVDHIVGTYGRDALVALIRSYATGVTDDEAFKAALGVDLAGFQTEWLRSIGATAPVKRGPQAAPAGPLPGGWSGAAVAPSVGPAESGSAAPPPSSSPAGPRSTGDPLVAVLMIVAALVAAAVIGRRSLNRRRAANATPLAAGWSATPTVPQPRRRWTSISTEPAPPETPAPGPPPGWPYEPPPERPHDEEPGPTSSREARDSQAPPGR
jgi:Peptidase MA superfamily